jgi:hypothetical protein
MAKKKSISRKHKFKHVEAVPLESRTDSGVAREGAPAVTATRPTGRSDGAVVKDFGYVAQDLRRTLLLAGSLVALEIGLWYALTHTPLGSSVYSLVKI